MSHDPRSQLFGLTAAEVRERRAEYGMNELPTARASGLWTDILGLLREPMTLLLLGCGGIYAAVGDRQEALMLLGFVIFIMGLTLFQERKTGRALAELRDLASPRALVIRAGERMRVAGRELVQDDLIVLAEGDRVPADAVILQANNVTVDESLVSGESLPVRKGVWDGVRAFDRPGGEDLPFLAVHLPIVGLTLVPIVMSWPLVLMPIHIAFLHLVIDPACSIVFEAQPEETDVMRRAPRSTRAPMFGRRVIGISVAQGAAVWAPCSQFTASHLDAGNLSQQLARSRSALS